MFLLAQTQPDYLFLSQKLNIHNLDELKISVSESLKSIDLNMKKKDFDYLLFNKRNSERILYVADFFRDLK